MVSQFLSSSDSLSPDSRRENHISLEVYAALWSFRAGISIASHLRVCLAHAKPLGAKFGIDSRRLEIHVAFPKFGAQIQNLRISESNLAQCDG